MLKTVIENNPLEETSSNNKNSLWKVLLIIVLIIVSVLGTISIFSADVSVNSHHAIHLSHALPDGSLVILNSDSELEYNNNYTQERIVNLDGEAFFQVEKGGLFNVSTKEGRVVVLGSHFNILSRDGLFMVSCKSGKAQVISNDKSRVIATGERVRIKNGLVSAIEKINPTMVDSWCTGESYFERIPLQEVITSMSHKYDLDIDLPSTYNDRLFTGSFIHSDIESAIKMVLDPIGIQYEVSDKGFVKII